MDGILNANYKSQAKLSLIDKKKHEMLPPKKHEMLMSDAFLLESEY